MLGQKTVNINGTDYMITHFKTSQGLGIKSQIVKIVAPLFAVSDEKDKGGDISIQKVVMAISSNLDRAEVVSLCKEIISCTHKGSQAINFDLEFAGQYESLYELVKEILMWNYASVFRALGTHTE